MFIINNNLVCDFSNELLLNQGRITNWTCEANAPGPQAKSSVTPQHKGSCLFHLSTGPGGALQPLFSLEFFTEDFFTCKACTFNSILL